MTTRRAYRSIDSFESAGRKAHVLRAWRCDSWHLARLFSAIATGQKNRNKPNTTPAAAVFSAAASLLALGLLWFPVMFVWHFWHSAAVMHFPQVASLSRFFRDRGNSGAHALETRS